MQIKKLICDNCNGVIEYDDEKEILTCPYCGSEEIILYSEELKLAQYNASSKESDARIEEAVTERETIDEKVVITKEEEKTKREISRNSIIKDSISNATKNFAEAHYNYKEHKLDIEQKNKISPKEQRKNDKQFWKTWSKVMAFFMAIIIVTTIISIIDTNKNEDAGNIRAPIDHENCIGSSVNVVESSFIDAGFNNVQTISLNYEDAYTHYYNYLVDEQESDSSSDETLSNDELLQKAKEDILANQVVEITISGNNSFSSTTWFKPSATVRIYWYEVAEQ